MLSMGKLSPVVLLFLRNCFYIGLIPFFSLPRCLRSALAPLVACALSLTLSCICYGLVASLFFSLSNCHQALSLLFVSLSPLRSLLFSFHTLTLTLTRYFVCGWFCFFCLVDCLNGWQVVYESKSSVYPCVPIFLYFPSVELPSPYFSSSFPLPISLLIKCVMCVVVCLQFNCFCWTSLGDVIVSGSVLCF